MLKNFITYNKAVQFYKLGKTLNLPKHQRDQWLRASASIALNLAEGSAKPTKKDQKKFYFIALGSLKECVAILDLEDIQAVDLRDVANHLAALLFRLTRY